MKAKKSKRQRKHERKIAKLWSRTLLAGLGIAQATIISVMFMLMTDRPREADSAAPAVEVNAPPRPSEPRRTEAGADVAAVGAPRTTPGSVQEPT